MFVATKPIITLNQIVGYSRGVLDFKQPRMPICFMPDRAGGWRLNTNTFKDRNRPLCKTGSSDWRGCFTWVKLLSHTTIPMLFLSIQMFPLSYHYYHSTLLLLNRLLSRRMFPPITRYHTIVVSYHPSHPLPYNDCCSYHPLPWLLSPITLLSRYHITIVSLLSPVAMIVVSYHPSQPLPYNNCFPPITRCHDCCLLSPFSPATI